jgi:zona occludens toxin (predicted ATPase)
MVVVVAALLSVVVVGTVLSRSGGDGSSDAEAASAPAAEASPETTAVTAPSPEPAAAAAVALTGEVVTAGLISRRELIESFTTPGFGGELADLTSEQVTSMQLALTGSGRTATDLSVAEFPLRVRTVVVNDATATVEVWSLLVIASAGEPIARQAWRTVTLDLALVAGRWLVDGWASVEGPTPAGSPDGSIATGSEVDDRLSWSEVS